MDLSETIMALKHRDIVKRLSDLRQAEEEWESILSHLPAVEDIVKRRRTFLTVTEDDLVNLGVVGKPLIFHTTEITESLQHFTPAANAEISYLYSRIRRMYDCVNMDFSTGPRIILDAILLSLAEIASSEQRNIAILPEMRVPHFPENEIKITHPVSGFELLLSGEVDYAVIEYDNSGGHTKNFLLDPRGPTTNALKISTSSLFLVQAKRRDKEWTKATNIPEAVSQAASLLKSTNASEIRFCLSDGQFWIFFVLKLQGETLTYYQSGVQYMTPAGLEISDRPLREICLLLSEWIRPTREDLFHLLEL